MFCKNNNNNTVLVSFIIFYVLNHLYVSWQLNLPAPINITHTHTRARARARIHTITTILYDKLHPRLTCAISTSIIFPFLFRKFINGRSLVLSDKITRCDFNDVKSLILQHTMKLIVLSLITRVTHMQERSYVLMLFYAIIVWRAYYSCTFEVNRKLNNILTLVKVHAQDCYRRRRYNK